MTQQRRPVMRIFHGPDLDCGVQGCAHDHATSSAHTSAVLAPALRNPATGGTSWFHGASFDPSDDEDGGQRRPEPGSEHNLTSPHLPSPGGEHHDPGGTVRPPEEHNPSYGGFETGERIGHHWNTDLGSHFSSLASVAKGFASGQYGGAGGQNSRVLHASLHMANPKRYADETEMAHHAIRWARENGHKFLGSEADEGDHERFIDGEFGYEDGEDGEGPIGAHLDHLHQHTSPLIRSKIVGIDKHGPMSYGDRGEHLEAAEHYLGLHPEREEVTEGFRQHLQDQGHDGIVYGNDHEGPPGHACAIAFPDTHVHQKKWDWQHPSKQHLNEPERKSPEPIPGQGQLPLQMHSNLRVAVRLTSGVVREANVAVHHEQTDRGHRLWMDDQDTGDRLGSIEFSRTGAGIQVHATQAVNPSVSRALVEAAQLHHEAKGPQIDMPSVEDDPERWGPGGYRTQEFERDRHQIDHSQNIGDGITLHHMPPDDEYGIGSVYAHDGSGVIGHAFYGDHPSVPGAIEGAPRVAPEHRGRGLGSAMYSYIEDRTGKKMAPAEKNSELAKALWSGDRRQFGKTSTVLTDWIPTQRLFAPTKDSVDPILFDADRDMKPEVRQEILSLTDGFFASHGYGISPTWARVFLAGSQASEWYGNRDFDLLIGINYPAYRQDRPQDADLSNKQIDDRFNLQLRDDFNDDDWHPNFDPDQAWSRTGYVNPNSWNIAEIKPYAAYDVTDGDWAVQPLDEPQGHTFNDSEWYYFEGVAEQARHALELAGSARTQACSHLWQFIHSDRSRAFGPQGTGAFDYRNALEKYLDQATSPYSGVSLMQALANVRYGKEQTKTGMGMSPFDAQQQAFPHDEHGTHDHHRVYLRFGDWHPHEQSTNFVTGHPEDGVSVYELNKRGNPIDPDGAMDRDEHLPDDDYDKRGNDTTDEMRNRVHKAERAFRNGVWDAGNARAHLVTGDHVGFGHDDEPLLKNVKRVGDWIQHRHLFIPGAEKHHLALEPGSHDDQERQEYIEHDFGHDLHLPGKEQKTAAAQGPDEVPAEPGTSAIPEGHVRLWHYTRAENLGSIAQHGLLASKARGDGGSGPDEPSSGVWASSRTPSHDRLQTHHFVEFHAHPSEISSRADRAPTEDNAAQWNHEGEHHVIMKGDVSPDRIVGIHSPWHRTVKFMKEHGGADRYDDIAEEFEPGSREHRAYHYLKGQSKTAGMFGPEWYENAHDDKIDEHPATDSIRSHMTEHVGPQGHVYRLTHDNAKYVHAAYLGKGDNRIKKPQFVGSLSWFGGKAEHGPGATNITGRISKVFVKPAHRRRGLASAMLDHARAMSPNDDILHSSALSEDGKAWSDKKASLRRTATEASDLTISREYYPHGGSKYGHRYEMKATDADGQEQGWLRYHEPKRKGSPIHVEEVRGHAPGVASHLLNDLESLHPEASRTEFLGEKNTRHKNTPGSHDGEHGKPTDWDQHYDSLGDIHRGFSVRLDPRDARTVNSPDHPAAAHVQALQGKVDESNAGIHWTSDLRGAKNFAAKHQWDPRTDIPVILHAQKPSRGDIETRPRELFRNGVFPHDHLEKEVPIRRGKDVQLTGISWKPDSPHPDADEDGWLHHTFTEPMTKRAFLKQADDDDYRMQHQAPGPDDTPVHEMPDDIGTHPEHYGVQRVGRPSQYHCTVEHQLAKRSSDNALAAGKQITQALGKPEHKVDIYRAVPKHVDSIHTGDWVTLHPGYAQSHGESYMGDDYKILKASVPAKHVNWDWGGLDEFGYNGPHIHHAAEHTDRQPTLPWHDEDGTVHHGALGKAESSTAKLTHGDYEVGAVRVGDQGEAWAYHKPTGDRIADMHWGDQHTREDCPDGQKWCSDFSHFTPSVIRGMGVHPDHRRQGVATAMLRAAHDAGASPIHSPARSDAGDAWARSVGGDVPERTSTPAAAFFDPSTGKHYSSLGEPL